MSWPGVDRGKALGRWVSSFWSALGANPVRLCLIIFFLFLTVAWDKAAFRACLFTTDVKDTGGTCFGDSDFVSHWTSARLTAQGQSAETYIPLKSNALASADIPIDHTTPPFRLRGNAYPPTMNAVLRPLAGLDFPTAYRVFVGAGLALFLWMAWQWGGALFASIALSFSGTWITFYAGQNGLFTGGLLGLGFAWMARFPRLAGVCFGLCCVKPQFGLLLPPLLLIGREGKVFMAAAVTVVLMVLLSFVTAGGGAAWQAFFTEGTKSASDILNAFHLWPRFESVYGALRQQAVGRSPALAFQGVSAALALTTAALVWIRTRHPGLRGAAALFATLLSVPVVYDYDLPIALAACFAFLSVGLTRWSVLASPVLFLIYLLPAFLVSAGVRLGLPSVLPLAFWVMLLTCLRLSASTIPSSPHLALPAKHLTPPAKKIPA